MGDRIDTVGEETVDIDTAGHLMVNLNISSDSVIVPLNLENINVSSVKLNRTSSNSFSGLTAFVSNSVSSQSTINIKKFTDEFNICEIDEEKTSSKRKVTIKNLIILMFSSDHPKLESGRLCHFFNSIIFTAAKNIVDSDEFKNEVMLKKKNPKNLTVKELIDREYKSVFRKLLFASSSAFQIPLAIHFRDDEIIEGISNDNYQPTHPLEDIDVYFIEIFKQLEVDEGLKVNFYNQFKHRSPRVYLDEADEFKRYLDIRAQLRSQNHQEMNPQLNPSAGIEIPSNSSQQQQTLVNDSHNDRELRPKARDTYNTVITLKERKSNSTTTSNKRGRKRKVSSSYFNNNDNNHNNDNSNSNDNSNNDNDNNSNSVNDNNNGSNTSISNNTIHNDISNESNNHNESNNNNEYDDTSNNDNFNSGPFPRNISSYAKKRIDGDSDESSIEEYCDYTPSLLFNGQCPLIQSFDPSLIPKPFCVIIKYMITRDQSFLKLTMLHNIDGLDVHIRDCIDNLDNSKNQVIEKVSNIFDSLQRIENFICKVCQTEDESSNLQVINLEYSNRMQQNNKNNNKNTKKLFNDNFIVINALINPIVTLLDLNYFYSEVYNDVDVVNNSNLYDCNYKSFQTIVDMFFLLANNDIFAHSDLNADIVPILATQKILNNELSEEDLIHITTKLQRSDTVLFPIIHFSPNNNNNDNNHIAGIIIVSMKSTNAVVATIRYVDLLNNEHESLYIESLIKERIKPFLLNVYRTKVLTVNKIDKASVQKLSHQSFTILPQVIESLNSNDCKLKYILVSLCALVIMSLGLDSTDMIVNNKKKEWFPKDEEQFMNFYNEIKNIILYITLNKQLSDDIVSDYLDGLLNQVQNID